MKIPKEVYGPTITDADTQAFFQLFDEPVGGSVLEVGAHDEPVANLLTDHGFHVTGVDLREYHAGQDMPNAPSPKCNYRYIQNDFCALPEYVHREFLGKLDCIISLSALEHFGLNTYGEGSQHPFYDVIAARLIWDFLKEGGVAYITVPFGKHYVEAPPHWRIYDTFAVRTRLVQDFHVEFASAFIAGKVIIGGQERHWGFPLTMEEACEYDDPEEPHVSLILKMRKREVKRLAPDGR